MNYIVEYERLRRDEWVGPLYQVMSAADITELGQAFNRMFDRESYRATRVIWWENAIRQELRKKKSREPAGTGYAAK